MSATFKSNQHYRLPEVMQMFVSVKPSQQVQLLLPYTMLLWQQDLLPLQLVHWMQKLLKKVAATAKELIANKGKSLVVSGVNNVAIQNIVNGINSLLENYGTTIDLDNANNLRQGSDADLTAFLDEMNKGEVAALFVII